MIYLDNAATTRVLPQAAAAAADMMQNGFGNPASLHGFGLQAEKALQTARRQVAQAVGAQPEEIFFCPGGTYADNGAILGACRGKRKGRIISSAFEHPAVEECLKSLEKTFEVIRLRPIDGRILPEQVEQVLTEDTVLVTLMQVNNETGAVTDLKGVRRALRRVGSQALLHTDAVQGFLKEEPPGGVADLISLSGHKTHGPKGIGALYVKKGRTLPPLILGGGQEGGLFSGTHNVPAAVGWGVACELLAPRREEARQAAEELRRRLTEGVRALGGEILSPADGSPFVTSIAFPGYLGENLLHALSARGIFVSTGAACSSKKPGAVMRAIGREDMSRFALRVSLSFENTQDEIQELLAGLKACLGTLRQV